MWKRIAIGCAAVAVASATALSFECAASDSEPPFREARNTWTARLGERPSGGPWLFGDSVLYFTYSGTLVNLSAATGERVWEAKLEGPQVSEPSLHDGVLYLGAEARGLQGTGGQLVAIDAATGKERWAGRTGPSRPAGRALVLGDAVVATTQREWIAFHRITGKELWRYRSERGALEAVAAGPTVLLGEYAARLQAVDVLTGKVKWQFLAASASFPRGEVFARDVSVAAQTDEARRFLADTPARGVYAFGLAICHAILKGATRDQIVEGPQFLGPEVGQALWVAARKSLCPEGTSMEQLMALAKASEAPSREGIGSAPTVHREKVFVRTLNDDMPPTGAVYVLDRDTGAVLFRATANYGGSPVGDDGTVYFMAVTQKRAQLHAVEIPTGKPLWVVDLSAQHVSERARLMRSEKFLFAHNVKIDRKTGAIESPMPIDLGSPYLFESPSEAGEPMCFGIHQWPQKPFLSRFDVANAKALWAFPLGDLKSPGQVACDENRAFFYDDWGDHPVFGVQLQ